MDDQQLSPHFKLSELARPADGDPPPDVLTNLTRLAQGPLEHLRAGAIAKGLTTDEQGLTIDDGWRPEAHNAEVPGAAKHSEHLVGNAADPYFKPLSEGPDQIIAAAIASEHPDVGGLGLYHGESCLHLDIRERVDGKITHWYQDEHGEYVATPDWLREALVAHGAVDLL